MASADTVRISQKHYGRVAVRIAALLGAGFLIVSVAGCGTANSPSETTPEEPGKDIVSYGVNPDAWMRVEVLQDSLTDQQMEQDARNILASTPKTVQAIATKDLPNNPLFQTCKAWYANGVHETSMVYAAKINGTPVRFFVHLPKEWESPAQFQAMMASLQVLQPGQTASAS